MVNLLSVTGHITSQVSGLYLNRYTRRLTVHVYIHELTLVVSNQNIYSLRSHYIDSDTQVMLVSGRIKLIKRYRELVILSTYAFHFNIG